MRKQLTDKSLVPVAYQVRMSDGRWGTIFHHPDKPLGDHRPLYAHPPQPTEDELDEAWKSGFNAGFGEAKLIAHPPQPSASVVEAMKHLQDIINCGNCSGSRQSARLALRALKGGE